LQGQKKSSHRSWNETYGSATPWANNKSGFHVTQATSASNSLNALDKIRIVDGEAVLTSYLLFLSKDRLYIWYAAGRAILDFSAPVSAD